VVAHPEVLVQLRQSQFRTPRVLTYTEGYTEASVKGTKVSALGKGVEVRRSHQAVACKKRYTVELGKARCTPDVVTRQVGHRKVVNCLRVVLSSIVLSGGESPLQGEGLDGST